MGITFPASNPPGQPWSARTAKKWWRVVWQLPQSSRVQSIQGADGGDCQATFHPYVNSPGQLERSQRTGGLPMWLIYKKGCKEDLGNYRPVSLTLVPGKALGQIILSDITQHAWDNQGTRPSKHGFMKGSSYLKSQVFLEFRQLDILLEHEQHYVLVSQVSNSVCI